MNKKFKLSKCGRNRKRINVRSSQAGPVNQRLSQEVADGVRLSRAGHSNVHLKVDVREEIGVHVEVGSGLFDRGFLVISLFVSVNVRRVLIFQSLRDRLDAFVGEQILSGAVPPRAQVR